MKAVDYFKEKARMTNNCEYDYCTQKCPLNSRRNGTKKPCKEFETGNPEKAIEIVEKWAKENPVKTYLSVLLDTFPKVVLTKYDKTPLICPHNLFGGDMWSQCRAGYCVDCWNREYKEEE